MSGEKVCPFCSSSDVMVKQKDDPIGEYWVVECNCCGATGPINAEYLAILGWECRTEVQL